MFQAQPLSSKELYNKTNQRLELSSCKFEDKAFTQGSFIEPGEYLIICDDEDATSFSSFGNVCDCVIFISETLFCKVSKTHTK